MYGVSEQPRGLNAVRPSSQPGAVTTKLTGIQPGATRAPGAADALPNADPSVLPFDQTSTQTVLGHSSATGAFQSTNIATELANDRLRALAFEWAQSIARGETMAARETQELGHLWEARAGREREG